MQDQGKQVKKRVAERLAFTSTIVILLVMLLQTNVAGRDQRVYDNLMRSRDALLNQQAYLQKALDALNSQAKDIDDKIGRVKDYMAQNDQALRDLDRAVRQAGF